MKKLFILTLISGFLFGCSTLTSTPDTTNETIKITEKIKNPQAPDALPEQGKVCGGNKNITCTLPLFCVFDQDSPTGQGTCQNLIVDKDLDCNEKLFKEEKPKQDPVCAQIGNQKYTLLNECEAMRRGATEFVKGFCKPLESVKNNCEASAAAMGTCFNTTEAWQFDGNECVQRFITGCDFEIPFETQAACEQQCN